MKFKKGFVPFLVLVMILLSGEKGYAEMLIPEPTQLVTAVGLQTNMSNYSQTTSSGAWVHNPDGNMRVSQGYFKWGLQEGDSWGFIYYEYINGIDNAGGIQEITRTVAVPVVTNVLTANEGQFTFSSGQINGHDIHGIGLFLNSGPAEGLRYVAWQGALCIGYPSMIYGDYAVVPQEPVETFPSVPNFSVPSFQIPSMGGKAMRAIPTGRKDNSSGQAISMPNVNINQSMKIPKPDSLPIFGSMLDQFKSRFGNSSTLKNKSPESIARSVMDRQPLTAASQKRSEGESIDASLSKAPNDKLTKGAVTSPSAQNAATAEVVKSPEITKSTNVVPRSVKQPNQGEFEPIPSEHLQTTPKVPTVPKTPK